MRHLSESQIERVVMGSEELSHEDRMHLAGCASCAEALRQEAAHELALHAAMEPRAERASVVVRPRVRRAFAWASAAAAAAFLLAAAAVLWRHPVPSEPPPRSAEVYGAVPAESLALAPGFREPRGLEPGAGDSSFSMIGSDVFVEPGELVMVE